MNVGFPTYLKVIVLDRCAGCPMSFRTDGFNIVFFSDTPADAFEQIATN